MSSSGFFDSNNIFGSDWEGEPDTSGLIDYSPNPTSRELLAQDNPTPSLQQPSPAVKQEPRDDHHGRRSKLAVPHATTSQQSSTSPSISHSSSSDSPSHFRYPYASGFGGPAQGLSSQPAYIKMEGMFGDDGQGFGMDSNYPSVNSDMEDLSLSTGASMDFGAADSNLGGIFTNERDRHDMNPRTMGAIRNAHSLNVSPQMTVSPKKMFSLESREESPNDLPMNSGQSSPFPLQSNSPNVGDFSNESIDGKMGSASGAPSSSGKGAATVKTEESGNESIPPSGLTQPELTQKWPCELLVDPTPDKSRVETQIPIKLTLRNPPPGALRLHLPGYTISKPKFQHKPPFEGDEDTLELSVLLVCASAMRTKEGAIERAFTRAESEEVPVRTDDSPGGDDADPDRPLNGGPVTICGGCIVRERKRANRKKNKKQEEEEEWQKDEAKRVIVFNCPELKDWCISGTKETPVRDAQGPVESMFVNAPMRIACYCRHQSEKVGFQVIFTIRRHGEIIGQGISQSIMITDDHKQPPPSSMSGVFNNNSNTQQNQQQPAAGNQGMFQQNQAFQMFGQSPNFGPHTPQDLPFRPSFSVPNLSQMAHQFPQQGGNGFQRQFSSNNLSSIDSSQANKSVSATPRTLSRPASPTNPAGQPGPKKRRSGGSGHQKVPSGLSMTKIDTNRSPPTSSGPLTGTSSSAGFNFQSPTSSSFATTPLDGAFPQHHQHMRTLSAAQAFQGQQPTPQHMAYGPVESDMSQFYSAPTSQHQSRAPSPSQGSRYAAQRASYAQQQLSHSQMAAMQSQAVAVLSSLPPGLNLEKPPVIQRLIPSAGTRNGGDEVTVLGSGFCQGLQVMFGDSPAASTTYWGDTTLVCHTPPCTTQQAGPVDVVFRHQHPHTPSNVSNVPALMPSRLVQFMYQSEPFGAHLGGNNSGMIATGHGIVGSAGSPLGSSPGMDDGAAGPQPSPLGGMHGMARGFFAQQAAGQGAPGQPSPGHTPPRQMPGSGSAGFNPAAQARRQPLSRTMSGDAGAFRRVG